MLATLAQLPAKLEAKHPLTRTNLTNKAAQLTLESRPTFLHTGRCAIRPLHQPWFAYRDGPHDTRIKPETRWIARGPTLRSSTLRKFMSNFAFNTMARFCCFTALMSTSTTTEHKTQPAGHGVQLESQGMRHGATALERRCRTRMIPTPPVPLQTMAEIGLCQACAKG